MNAKLFLGLGKLTLNHARRWTVVAAALTVAACGGGGGGGGSPSPPPPPPPPPPPAPAAPVANAGADQTVQEMTEVNLSGSATDANGDPITYMWVQTAGTVVTLNTPDAAAASFTAPDVTAGNPEELTFELTASDPGGLSTTDAVNILVQESTGPVTISGTLQYEFPPPNNACLGLDFDAIQLRLIRQATVQLLDAVGSTVLDTDVSDDLGQYSVTADPSTDVIIRVLAESIRVGNLSWDVQVRNNVDTSNGAPPLDQRPIYAMDSSAFDSGTSPQSLDLTATTGWGGSSYTGPRAAAPFAILDSIYSATLFVATDMPNATFPPLDAFWSVDNKATSPTDIDAGDLPTSFYNGQSQLFLLGMDGSDTEEFDDHVVVHEWGHYLEDNLSRSDSIGGSHFIGSDLLDKRVAFGEGFANALSGMVLDDPVYCDTAWFGNNQSGFGVDLEEEPTNNEGWYDEVSVFEILYDLWDTDTDGVDTGSIGFGPILDVMTGPQVTSPAFTSIFTFATYLKQQNPGDTALIDALLTDHNINSNVDIHGSSEINDGPGTPPDVLPVYTDITLGQMTNICVNAQFDPDRDGNKLSEHRYLRLNIPSNSVVTFTMTANPAPSQPSNGFDCEADLDDPENSEHSDPDYQVWRDGQLFWTGFSCEPNSEVSTTNGWLAAGDYVIDINDYRHADTDSPVDYPEQVCFDFTAN